MSETIRLLEERERLLWWIAVASFGVGDLVTTVLGLYFLPVVEVGPVAAVVLHEYGLTMLLPLKVGTFLLVGAVWTIVPSPHRVGVPLGLSTVGVLVSFWNSLVIVLAAVG